MVYPKVILVVAPPLADDSAHRQWLEPGNFLSHPLHDRLAYSVQTCSTGATALTWCQQHLPDILLLQVPLPDGDVLDFLEQFKRQPGSHQTTIVMLTDIDHEEIAIQSLDYGAHDYLLPPEQTSRQLHRILRHKIAQSDLRQQLEQDYQAALADFQTAEAELRGLFNGMVDVVFVVSREGRYLKIAPTNPNKLYRPPEELLGKTAHDIFPPHQADYFVGLIEQTIVMQQTSECEYSLQIGDQEFWFHAKISAISAEAVIWVARDISDRKRAEAALHQLNQELEDRVAQRTLDLQHSNECLIQANAELEHVTRLKDEFLANMSHELRTPLNAILGMAEGLQEHVFGAVNDRQLKAISTIEHSGSHLLELINDILDLAKIESGNLELNLGEVPIKRLCDASLNFVRHLATTKGLQLHASIPEEIGTVLADELRIRQVLINLLSNAVKFTPTGAVTLAVSRSHRPPPNLPPTTANSSWITFAVTDTGIGIEQTNLEQIFQPFLQVDSRLNRQYSGTGLGLALVKQIAVQHNGTVTVESQAGQGSCFTVWLPDQSPQVTHLGHPLILCVANDHLIDTQTTVSYLEAKGYNILMADTGETAIALAHQMPPNLVLLHLPLTTLSNLQTDIQTIHASSSLSGVPLIVVTPAPDPDHCFNSEVSAYFAKPVKLKQLTATIQQLLDH